MTNLPRWEPTGSYDFEVVGESHYQDALKRIAGAEKRTRVVARMVCEKNNPYDKNAVKVEIDGMTVGHLTREVALFHRQELQSLNQVGATVECEAVVVRGKDGILGVYLDLPFNDEDIGKTDFNETDRNLANGGGIDNNEPAKPLTARPKANPVVMATIAIVFVTVLCICVSSQNTLIRVICIVAAAGTIAVWLYLGGRLIK